MCKNIFKCLNELNLKYIKINRKALLVALFNFLLFTAFHILVARWSNLFLSWWVKAVFTSSSFTLIQFHPSPHEAHSSPVRTKWLCQCLSPLHSLSLSCLLVLALWALCCLLFNLMMSNNNSCHDKREYMWPHVSYALKRIWRWM